MLLAARNLSKSYGAITVLNDVSFVINNTDRIGIVGSNGVGKSTLLHLLVGQEEQDSGRITYAPSVEFGYLAQTIPDFYGRTIQDLLMEAVGNLRQLEERMRTLEVTMSTANAEQISTLLEEYSVTSTNALLLDEPTNYISLDVLEAFEAAVLAFPGPVITISHDRWFIQRFGGELWELSEGRIVKTVVLDINTLCPKQL